MYSPTRGAGLIIAWLEAVERPDVEEVPVVVLVLVPLATLDLRH